MHWKSNYLRQITSGFIGYALGLFALNYFYPAQSAHGKYELVLLPMLPMLYLVAAILRGVSELDEMKRKIYTEAMAFSGLATGFTCFSYLFLRDLGAVEFRAEWAFYMMGIYYLAGAFISWRRYR